MSAQWSERREAGGRFAIWLIRAAGLHAGRGFARAWLYPITLYFYFRRTRERRDSREFLSIALGRPARAWDILRHIHSYAATILDRIYLLHDATLDRFDLRVHGLDQIEAEIARGRGVLLLGAHFGSFEALRALSLHQPEVKLRVVMDLKQTRALNEVLHALNPEVANNVIDAGVDPGALALSLHEAAQQGALIGLLADRPRAGEPTAGVEFFGRTAQIPVAAYQIASMLELPVVLGFGIYRGGNRYDLHFETLAQSIKIPRSDRAAQLQVWAHRFSARLEHYARQYPYNWFNFYDFWDRSAQQPARDAIISVGNTG
ncbi:MAG: acyltransferase [Proteobacteria bacterium]|uniref:LpxL/LpxP family acyltransferase n=1 Tax=Rudaea sp. TaxID=2136325 RepID=UPI00321FA822|nr:acyltransferase [Pseudomonadota bacterium]